MIASIAAVAQQHYILAIRTLADLAIGHLISVRDDNATKLGRFWLRFDVYLSYNLAIGKGFAHHNLLEFNAVDGTGLNITRPSFNAVGAEDVLASGR